MRLVARQQPRRPGRRAGRSLQPHAGGKPRHGDRGRSLIMETYASPQVAASMKRLYRYLLGQEPKPEFVDLS